MKISWKAFAQRRKLNLEMFSEMTYESYSEWCKIRSVDPVSEDSFEGVKAMVAPEKIQEEAISLPTFDEKQLKKMRKQNLVKLCEDIDCKLDGDETKSTLITLLLSLNNRE